MAQPETPVSLCTGVPRWDDLEVLREKKAKRAVLGLEEDCERRLPHLFTVDGPGWVFGG